MLAGHPEGRAAAVEGQRDARAGVDHLEVADLQRGQVAGAQQVVPFGGRVAVRARGHGYGTEAQRLLAALLFRLFDIERIEASTDVESIAEQRSLEKAGFTREGILRHAQWRAGAHHDLVSYSILRKDL